MVLQEISRRKAPAEEPSEDSYRQAVVDMAIDNPTLGQVRVLNELHKKRILISSGGVRSTSP